MRYAAAVEAPMVPAVMEKPAAKRALDAAAEPPPVAPKRISDKVRAGIGYMVSGDCKTQTEAAEKAGLPPVRRSHAVGTNRLERNQSLASGVRPQNPEENLPTG